MILPRCIRRRFGPLAFAFLGLSSFSRVDVEAGNTTCAGNLTDWYTNAVGETACETYQRLRQICNAQYQVPSFRANTPGDNCDDQLADCCCNSISWALSMLCMNCQWDVLGSSSIGIDAGVGAYGMYRNPSGSFCSPGTNQSLPSDVQTAACNAGIKLDNFLYELFWNDGAWFFVYTTEYAGEQQVQYNNNTFTNCNSTTSTTSVAASAVTWTSLITAATSVISLPSATTSINSTSTTSTSTSSHSNTASVVGGAVGGVAGLALIIAAGFFCWRRRNRDQPLLQPDRNVSTMSAVTPYTLTPFNNSAQPSSDFTRQYTSHTNTASDIGPRSDGGTAISSRAVDAVLFDLQTEPGRHEDLGPVETLHRSGSGRLPPAYNPQWEPPSRPQARPLPQPMASNTTTPPIVTPPSGGLK